MTTLIDMDALKESAPRMYRTIVAKLDLSQGFGVQEIDLNRYSDFTRGELTAWLAAQKTVAKVEPPATPVKPVEQEPQIDVAQMDAEFQRGIKTQADAKLATDRIEQYAVEQGLARTPENVAKIQLWLDSNVRGYWSTAGVDAAIQNLGARGTNVLTWEQKVVAPAPEPESTEPVEVLSLLPDGRMQIPLETTPAVLRKASKDQAKDWLKRSASRQQQSHSVGRFGSRF